MKFKSGTLLVFWKSRKTNQTTFKYIQSGSVKEMEEVFDSLVSSGEIKPSDAIFRGYTPDGKSFKSLGIYGENIQTRLRPTIQRYNKDGFFDWKSFLREIR